MYFDLRNKPKGWMANHSRWCDLNPKRKEYSEKSEKSEKSGKWYAAMHARKGKGTNQFTKAKELGLEKPEISLETRKKMGDAWRGKKHTEASKKKMSKSALSSEHRRLRKGIVEYNGILLDSSWELALAARLDELGIVWERPSPLKWLDAEGNEHNYFPDFYLPEYDLYLDPKNPQAVKVQREKLNILLTTYKNIVIIETLDECKEYNPKSSDGPGMPNSRQKGNVCTFTSF